MVANKYDLGIRRMNSGVLGSNEIEKIVFKMIESVLKWNKSTMNRFKLQSLFEYVFDDVGDSSGERYYKYKR
jgi:hypothetical protein